MRLLMTQNWNSYLEKFDRTHKDIYFYEEYVKLYEKDGGKAFCVICHEDDAVLLMPFIRKPVGEYFDFETAYGYGGLLSNVDDLEWIGRAMKAMQDFLIQERFVCGFIRFHPLLNNARLCKDSFEVLFDRNTVVIDTEKREEEIWTDQIVSKCRNMIRKAEKNGLIYKAERDFESLDEFIQIYNATMKRLNAEEFYFFDISYYKKFVEVFKNNSFLGTVRKDGKLICAALFIYSGEYGHYHLEGSDHAYSGLGANNFLLWKTAAEFHSMGVRKFHLGGGYDAAPDNSLLKFKKSFSNNLKEFYIGKMILNQAVYDEFKREWAKENPEKVEQYGKRLLCYRY